MDKKIIMLKSMLVGVLITITSLVSALDTVNRWAVRVCNNSGQSISAGGLVYDGGNKLRARSWVTSYQDKRSDVYKHYNVWLGNMRDNIFDKITVGDDTCEIFYTTEYESDDTRFIEFYIDGKPVSLTTKVAEGTGGNKIVDRFILVDGGFYIRGIEKKDKTSEQGQTICQNDYNKDKSGLFNTTIFYYGKKGKDGDKNIDIEGVINSSCDRDGNPPGYLPKGYIKKQYSELYYRKS
ncbi:MAG: hypothetical protein K0R14_1871 [Burkholderiales bacterium]|jgi:hypothetical protein|nr:hypothetical protein [Burkholderiales bacterium]